MKKISMKNVLVSCLAALMVCSAASCSSAPSSSGSAAPAETPAPPAQSGAPMQMLSFEARPDNPATVPVGLEMDWNRRYSYDEFADYLKKMSETFPELTELYSIGTSYQERDLWCLEISNKSIDQESKTGIGVFANIHGGERESAASAMYTAWWILLNTEDDYVKGLLDNYIIYVVPFINPDGYEQSWVINTRQNLRPRDLNGDGVAFSDPYTDIDGDGYIAAIYRGAADATPSTDLPLFGTESPNWDANGVLGDDPRNSGIDMNRTFSYQWNRYDIDKQDTQPVGGKTTWDRSKYSPGPAAEPEVQAVQNFLNKTPMNALCTIHTGVQCVLVPWCYRAADASNPKDADIPFMVETAKKMANVMHETTGRDFFASTSYDDIPTSGELIDYAFGRLNIHPYTIEIYLPGDTQNRESTNWGNTMPEPTWVFYSQDDIKSKLNLDPAALIGVDGSALAPGEGLWFYTSSDAQMVDKVPDEQDVMVKGARDAILTMIESEPHGAGYQRPAYLE